ncbi:MAG: hypothetical protein DWQ06_01935 [Calditrichaeota bacterium]|nr:MAG: hypothetical protein DWQ06_01935 [Calditrichota bacterium]
MFKYNTLIKFLFAIFSISFIACSNDDNDEKHDHADAEGLVLKIEEQTIVTYKEGVVTGSLTISDTAETEVELAFLDDDGDEFVPHEDDGFTPEYVVSDTNIFVVEAEDGEHNHSSEETHLAFHIEGKQVGTATLTIKLLHNGHSDFTSKEIPVIVQN